MIGSQPSFDVQTFPTIKLMLLSSPPDVSSGKTTVCCSIESSDARACEIEVPKKKYNLHYFCSLQEHVLADLTCTLPVSIVVSGGGFQPLSSKLQQIKVIQLVYG